jgi:hypothetical protein
VIPSRESANPSAWRPADWKYVEAAGWVQLADTYEREVEDEDIGTDQFAEPFLPGACPDVLRGHTLMP